MAPEIVILGGGVGGTLTANLAVRDIPGARVRLVDATGRHEFQPGWLDLALDRADSRWLSKDLRHLVRAEVEILVDRALDINPSSRTVFLEREGAISYDYLVIATGAQLDRHSIPGLAEGTHDFYSLHGAQRLRERLRTFDGGRILVGVAGLPYKCPPVPVEFTLRLDAHLRRRGIRDRTTLKYLSPVGGAFTIGSASDMVEPIMAKRGIELHTMVNVERVDAAEKRLYSLEGETFDYDLAVLVPPHKGAQVILDSGLADGAGWLATDPVTLQARGHGDVFALGDCTDLPASKSGSTAHYEAPVIVEQIAARIEDRRPDPVKARYQGKVTCFLQTDRRQATMLVFDYDTPPKVHRPSFVWYAAKWLFNRAYWFTVPRGRI